MPWVKGMPRTPTLCHPIPGAMNKAQCPASQISWGQGSLMHVPEGSCWVVQGALLLPGFTPEHGQPFVSPFGGSVSLSGKCLRQWGARRARTHGAAHTQCQQVMFCRLQTESC